MFVDHRVPGHQGLAEVERDQVGQHLTKANQHRAIQSQLGAHSGEIFLGEIDSLVRRNGGIQRVSRQDLRTYEDNDEYQQKDQP